MQSKEGLTILRRLKEVVITLSNVDDEMRQRIINVENDVQEYKINKPIDYSQQLLRIQQMQKLCNSRQEIIENKLMRIKEEMLKIVDNLTQHMQAEVYEQEIGCEHKQLFDMATNTISPVPDEKKQQEIEQEQKMDIDAEIKKMDADIQDIVKSKLGKVTQQKKPEQEPQPSEDKKKLEELQKKHRELQENAVKALELIKEQKGHIQKLEAEKQNPATEQKGADSQ